MNRHIKIPMAAVAEIKRLQWQIEQAYMDLEKKCARIDVLEYKNSQLQCKLDEYNVPN